MFAILKREWKSYFSSPIGYIYLAMFYILSGIFFYQTISSKLSTTMYIFSSLFIVLILFIPILTMRLFSEEQKQKTEQLLLTSPVSLFSIVMGKFLAAFSIFLLGLCITVVYIFTLSIYASPDWLSFLGNLIGIILLGAALIAIGMFVSSLTENQIIANVASIGIFLILMFLDQLSTYVPIDFLAKALKNISIYPRYYEFTTGLFNLAHVLFFVSLAGGFLFLTTRVLERKRWS